MKKGIVLLATIFIVACATNTSSGSVPESERFYQQVLSTPGDKNTLYRLANEAMVDILASTEGEIEYQDKDEGVLKGKGMVITKTEGGIAFTLTIEVKDDKTRITFQNMHYPSSGDRLIDAFMVYHQGSQNQFLDWAEVAIADIERRLKQDRSDW